MRIWDIDTKLLQTLQGKYDTGIAFVSEQNPRSLRAHLDKLGVKVVDEFEFNGQKYHALVLTRLKYERKQKGYGKWFSVPFGQIC